MRTLERRDSGKDLVGRIGYTDAVVVVVVVVIYFKNDEYEKSDGKERYPMNFWVRNVQKLQLEYYKHKKKSGAGSGAVHWGTALQGKTAGSISDGVSAIFHWPNTPGRNIVLESTGPLAEMRTTNIS